MNSNNIIIVILLLFLFFKKQCKAEVNTESTVSKKSDLPDAPTRYYDNYNEEEYERKFDSHLNSR